VKGLLGEVATEVEADENVARKLVAGKEKRKSKRDVETEVKAGRRLIAVRPVWMDIDK
jgi:hypothetical protein